MSDLQDEIARPTDGHRLETNPGPWGDNSPYYLDDDYADDFLDWDEDDYNPEDFPDNFDPDDDDYEVISWDEYLASLPWLDRQWARFTAWWPIVRLSNWWYRLSTRLHLTRRHNRF